MKTMNQRQFEEFLRNRNTVMFETHWPKIRELLNNRQTPMEIAETMRSQGYRGFSGSTFSCRDVHRLLDLATELKVNSQMVPVVGPIGKRGGKARTNDLADFALHRRPQKSWKEIGREWKELHPDRPASNERLRCAFRRHYRGKDKPTIRP